MDFWKSKHMHTRSRGINLLVTPFTMVYAFASLPHPPICSVCVTVAIFLPFLQFWQASCIGRPLDPPATLPRAEGTPRATGESPLTPPAAAAGSAREM